MNPNRKLVAALVSVGAVGLVAAAVALADSSPTVVTGAVTSKQKTSAVLHGTVNPRGAATRFHFEWGLTNAYGAASKDRSAGHGTKNVKVKATAKGLLPGTLYHYRVVASNRFGIAVGADRTFRTKGNPLPGAATGPSVRIGRRAATVTGSVDPNGEATGYAFQYGLSTGYGQQTFGGIVPAGDTPVPVVSRLVGLAPGTPFHYRVIAWHGSFVTYGADAVFVTRPLRKRVSRLQVQTKPRRDRRRPFSFHTAGRLRGGGSLPAAARCSGRTAVAFWVRKRRVAFRLVPVRRNCTFSIGVRIMRHLPRKLRHHRRLRLRVAVRFRGNPYMAPARAHNHHVVLVHKRHGRRH